MEFVGKIVEKEFEGYGVFSGFIQSYDASSGFFEIVYEDGDSEELDFSEVAALLDCKEANPADHKQRLGRRPKKRRRVEPRKREDRGGEEELGNAISHTRANAENLGIESGAVVEANGKFHMDGNVVVTDGFIGNLREVDRGNRHLGNVTVDLNEALEKGSGVVETLRERGSDDGSTIGNCSIKEALDLNAGFNLNLNEAFDMNEEDDLNTHILRNLKKRECIDLNLDVNSDVDENMWEVDMGVTHTERQKKECGFDLNFGMDKEVKVDLDGDFGGEAKERTYCNIVKLGTGEMDDASGALDRIRKQGATVNGTLQEVHVQNDSYVGLAISGEDSRAGDSAEVHDAKNTEEDSAEVVDGNRCYMISANKEGSCGRRRRGRRRSIANSLNSAPEATVFTDAAVIYGNEGEIGSAYKESNVSQRRAKLVDTSSSALETSFGYAEVSKKDCIVVSDGKQDDIGSASKEVKGNCRKRRKFSDHVNATLQMTVLRRSTRRGSAKINISTPTALSEVHDLSVSPAVSALTEERPVKSFCEWPEEPVVLPPKVQLPPSSQNLDLDGISIINILSVYTCLRSVSTLLFLSPFELEEFVAAMKCNSPSLLFDCIHVSILQTLRLHLEYLSNEGSKSASICLRSINWGLLDLNTWPVFMVEYFLIHGSDLKPCFNFCHLNLLKNDYYK